MKVLEGDERKEALEYMAYQIIKSWTEECGHGPTRVELDALMYMMAKELKEKDDVDVALPYSWFVNGVEVEWSQFTDKITFVEEKHDGA